MYLESAKRWPVETAQNACFIHLIKSFKSKQGPEPWPTQQAGAIVATHADSND